MGSSSNRQCNLPTMQANNNLSLQSVALSTQSNVPSGSINTNQGWTRGASQQRRGHRGRGGQRVVFMNPSSNFGDQPQRDQNQSSYNNRGGRRGRSSKGRPNCQFRQETHQSEVVVEPTSEIPQDASPGDQTLQDSNGLKAMETSRNTLGDFGEISIVQNDSSEGAVIHAASSTNQSVGDRDSAPNNKNNKLNQSRPIGGKYKQRREARQLIDGLGGLDIDLIESLTSTNIDGNGRSRHATNTRKINLCHSVNNSYDRKRRSGTRHESSSGGHTERNTHLHYRYHNSGEHKFSKQQFLQANCQFVVLDGYDFTIHKVDPDWPVDWNCIEEVKFRQIGATETNCPICLEPPVAAKITKCGHIYCWACMLRYLSMNDDKKVPCPICFEPIHAIDLRSVVSESYPNHSVGEKITMKLMSRRKGCVEVEPHSMLASNDLETVKDESSYANLHYVSQANLIVVDPMTVVTQVAQREKNEILFKMDLDRAESEGLPDDKYSYTGMICFLEQALDKVNKRIEHLIELSGNGSRTARSKQQSLQATQISSDSSGRSYLFYQSSDGQHIYLNPFSTKILCQEYGSLEACPHEISAEILQMDWISMNEAWRKRFKYLEHLPLSCEFRLIEISLDNSELISPDTFKLFEEQIRSRAKERQRRLREEAKRDKQIQVEQNRKIYGIQPSLEISLDNFEQFPSVSNVQYLGLERSRQLSDGNDNEDHDEQESTNDELAAETDQATLSFAEIQLQEAAKVEKLARQQKSQRLESGSNLWGGPSGQRSARAAKSSQPQSSFAQLLVDAKQSQQKWTKSVEGPSSISATTQNALGNTNVTQTAVRRAANQADPEDDVGEELRAPPFEFSMSDYLDINILSGKKKGRKKKGS